MTTKGVAASLLFQIPSDPSSWMLNRLLSSLNDRSVTRAQLSVAYVTWQGLGQLERSLGKFLSRGSSLETIYGVGNGVTTPDALLYSSFMRDIHPNYRFAGTIEDIYGNSTFHPKMYAFFREGEIELLVGSANLTRGGLFMNTEAVLHIKASDQSALANQFAAVWDKATSSATTLSPDEIRDLVKKSKLTTERQAEPHIARPMLRGNFPKVLKPIFRSVLKSRTPRKQKHLLELDVATDRPRKLYLQVFKKETGGNESRVGYQVQLPVGCLSAYFGVAPDEARDVTIEMLGDTLPVSLTHFSNHTHRIRLRPLQNIARPAIIVFERVSDNEYVCTPVPRRDYTSVLAEKCTEQQRKGSRRWGME